MENFNSRARSLSSLFQKNEFVNSVTSSIELFRKLSENEEREPLNVHDQLSYNIPYPSIDPTYFARDGSLSDDSLLYIFSFLTYDDLFRVGRVCKQWYRVSCNDKLWELEYIRIFEDYYMGNCRDFFVEKMNRYGQLENVRKRVAFIAMLQSFLICGYGFFAPMIFVFGFFLTTIFAPLLMDGIIHNAQFLSTPVVVTLFAFLVMAIGLLVDPSFLNRIKRKYSKILREEKELEIDSAIVSYTFDRSRDEGWVPALNLLIWSIFVIPLIPICGLLRWCFFPNLRYSYSLCFVPLHAYTICYLLIPPLVMLIKWRNFKKLYENRRISEFIFVHANIINFTVSIQAMLIGLKLDEYIDASVHWSVVVIPLYLMLVFLTCFGCICGYSAKLFLGKVLYRSMWCMQIVFIPIIIFAILFCLKLDNIITWQFITVFIPLYVFEGIFTCKLFSFRI